MFPKKKLASLVITDEHTLQKHFSLKMNDEKHSITVHAKYQVVSHKRYLILDFCGIRDKKARILLKGMYAKDEFWYYLPEKEKFSHKDIFDQLWKLSDSALEYMDQRSKQICERFFGGKYRLQGDIYSFEMKCRLKKRKKKREMMLQKEKEIGSNLYPLPKNAFTYNYKYAPHLLIRDPEKYTCTCCKKEIEIPKKIKPLRHLTETTCPKCGASVTVQNRAQMKRCVDTISWTSVLQQTKDGGYVMRYLLFDRVYSKTDGETFLKNMEAARMYVLPDGTIHYAEKKGEHWETSTKEYFTEYVMWVPRRYFCGRSHFYTKGLAQVLSDLPGCEYYTDEMFDCLKGKVGRWYYFLLDFLKDKEGKRAFVYEQLLKQGYGDMVYDLMMEYGQRFQFEKLPLLKLFGFNKTQFRRWKMYPNLYNYRLLDKVKFHSDQEYELYIDSFGFESRFADYLNGKKLSKVVGYLKKQVANYQKSGKFSSRSDSRKLLQYMMPQWDHYIYNLILLYGGEINEQMLYPKDFYKLDEQVTKELEEKKEKEAQMLNKRYEETMKKISAALRDDKDIQRFMGKGCAGLKVFVPTTAEELRREGKRMGNCLASYVDKVATGNTSIFFIRKINAPDKEYYAMEYKNGKIKQLHGKGNSDDSTGKVTAFADAFAKVLKKIDWQPVRFVA